MPRKYSKHTQTWRMFEKLFIDLPSDKYPYKISNLTRGQAINMAMMLNGCQLHWAREQGMPKEMLIRSAKAKEDTQTNTWYLEISNSPKRLGRPATDWQSKILAQLEQDIPSIPQIRTMDAAHDYTIQHDDPLEARIAAFAQGGSGVDEAKQNE